MNLPKIALDLRTLHFYTQSAHHRAKGPTFFPDHEFLGEAYEAHALAFDAILEIALGDGLTFDEQQINLHAAEAAAALTAKDGGSVPKMLQTVLDLEKRLQATLSAFASRADLGNQTYAGDLHRASKHRASYFLTQRLK